MQRDIRNNMKRVNYSLGKIHYYLFQNRIPNDIFKTSSFVHWLQLKYTLFGSLALILMPLLILFFFFIFRIKKRIPKYSSVYVDVLLSYDDFYIQANQL